MTTKEKLKKLHIFFHGGAHLGKIFEECNNAFGKLAEALKTEEKRISRQIGR